MARSLLQALQAQLSDVAVKLRVRRLASLPAGQDAQLRLARSLASRSGVTGVCWFDPNAGRAYVLLRSGKTLRLVKRTVGKAGEQGHHEAAAIAIRTTIRAHLQGQTRGRPPTSRGKPRPADHPPPRKGTPPARRRVTHRPQPPPATRGRSPTWRRLELELSYAVDVHAPGQVAVAHGPQLGILVNLHRRWALYLGYRLDPALRARSQVATLDFWRHLLELGVRLRFRLGRWELGARVGLDVTAITRRTTPADPGVEAINPGPDWLVAVAGLGCVGFRPVSRLVIQLAAGARFQVTRRRYLSHEGSLLLAPWIVQPTVLLGIGVDIY